MKKIEKVIVDKKDFNKLFLGKDGKPLKRSKKKHKWQDDKLYPNKTTCNQCGEQMDAILELEKWTIPVCTNLSCPNFALLQISVEKMFEFIDKSKKYV